MASTDAGVAAQARGRMDELRNSMQMTSFRKESILRASASTWDDITDVRGSVNGRNPAELGGINEHFGSMDKEMQQQLSHQSHPEPFSEMKHTSL